MAELERSVELVAQALAAKSEPIGSAILGETQSMN